MKMGNEMGFQNKVGVSEKQVENYLLDNLDKYYPEDTLVRNQSIIDNVGRPDILLVRRGDYDECTPAIAFPNAIKEVSLTIIFTVIEIKTHQATTQDVGQLARYVQSIDAIFCQDLFQVGDIGYVLSIDVYGHLWSPSIERDAFALCGLRASVIKWRPYAMDNNKFQHSYHFNYYNDVDWWNIKSIDIVSILDLWKNRLTNKNFAFFPKEKIYE